MNNEKYNFKMTDQKIVSVLIYDHELGKARPVLLDIGMGSKPKDSFEIIKAE